MKRDLKTEILHTAEQMFDEFGCTAVSLRNIADTLGISVGNLTYHYKRKEDLMEAVMQARHTRCKALPPPSTLTELDAFFRAVLERRSRGLLIDCRSCAEAREACRLHLLAVEHLGELLSGALSALENAGLLRPDAARPAAEQALLGMLLMARPAELLEGVPDPEQTRRCLWQLISLLLTTQGQAELDRLP